MLQGRIGVLEIRFDQAHSSPKIPQLLPALCQRLGILVQRDNLRPRLEHHARVPSPAGGSIEKQSSRPGLQKAHHLLAQHRHMVNGDFIEMFHADS